MKKTLSLVLALLFVLALFAGCNNGGATTPTAAPDGQATQAPATKAPATQAPATQAPSGNEPAATEEPEPVDEGPYHYAVGKYEKNADGFPVEKYVYEQPLTDNDDVLSKWSTCYTPQYIPEDGWGSIPVWQGVAEYTGVHIEYNIVDSANRSQNFSVLLASDDLDDICDQGGYFYSGGTIKQAIEDGYFVNLYPYKDYMPNYMWETYDRSRMNPDVMNTVFYDSETIGSCSGMLVEPAPGMGYFIREDWLRDLNLGTAADYSTYDQLHTALVAMKSAYSTTEREIFPFFINSVIENGAGALFGGYGTCVYTRIGSYIRARDGVVEFCGTTEDDREAMTLLNTWFNEGLISPNFQTFVAGEDYDAGTNTDGLGVNLGPPSGWQNMEDAGKEYNPNCQWECLKRLVKKDGDIIHYGNKIGGFHYGSAIVSGNCPNVELAASWLDWWMSEWGSWWTSWGPEGTLWEYNEKGEMRLTDWCMNWEGGMAWCMCMYGCNGLVEFCLQIHKRNYYYDGGERALTAFDIFTPTGYYDGAWEWASSIKLTDEEREETSELMSDLSTYYEENYVAFVDGSKPMSEWDSYINDLNTFGYQRIQEIYQGAYDRYMSQQ
jgi:putative aldouronate transport system substrate-binding protein